MEESPPHLASLASLEAQATEAYKNYAELSKSTQKLNSAGMELCKTNQGLVTLLKAPSFSPNEGASGGATEVKAICDALEGTVGLLRSLYSTMAHKPALKKVHDTMAEKRAANDKAQSRHHDALQRACTMKDDDAKATAKVDADVAARKQESQLRRLEMRQALEEARLAVQQEHAAIMASALFNQVSAYKAAYLKLQAVLPALSSLQVSAAAAITGTRTP